jgi:SWI/SNF-related matrix-associated actin-dependent regulator 1 of chromatin subfamily A
MKTFKRYADKGAVLFLDWKDPTNWTEIKDYCKTTLKATFDFNLKVWKVPNNPQMVAKLRENGWVSEEETKGATTNELIIKQYPDHADVVFPKDIPDEIRAYQREALQWLSVRNWRGIIALQPGSGKSLCGTIACALQHSQKPILIVTPVALKTHWSRELRHWAHINSLILNSSFTWDKVRSHHEVLITNVDILHKIYHELQGNIGGIIVDEADTFSKDTTKKYKAFVELWKGTEMCILLTGTPIRNRPVDLYNLLYFVDPVYWKDKAHYLQRYCNPSYSQFGGIVYNGATNLEELSKRVKPFIFWKPAEEILADMPKQNITIYKVQAGDAEFKKENDAIMAIIEENGWDIAELVEMDNPDAKQAEVLLRIKELSKSAYFHKRSKVLDFINEFMKDSEEDESFTLVGNHRAVLEDLKLQYKCDVINGGVPGHMRQKYVDDFNRGDKRVLALNTIAGGVGFSLPNCRHMFVVEPDYSANKTEQVMARIRRMTSVNKVSFYSFFVVVDSIEENMIKAISEKSKVATKVVEGEEKDLFANVIWDYID